MKTRRPLFSGWIFLLALVQVIPIVSIAYAANEGIKLEFETQIQQRIEGILSKTLPADSYIVTVNVEMENRPGPTAIHSENGGGTPGNPFLNGKHFMLPGVPEKKEFVQTQAASTNQTVVNAYSTEASIRRIRVKVLLAPDVPADQMKAIRDVVTSSIPFNPLRGDEIDVQTSTLLKPLNTANASNSSAAQPAAAAPASAETKPTSWWGELSNRASAPILFLLGAFTVLLVILIAFLFGPVRAFLNRLLAVLPRVGEQAAYAVSNNANSKNGSNPSPNGNGTSQNGHSQFNGSTNGNGNNSDAPFNFIREDQLNKLPILFQQMGAPQVALVLAYLPPAWASHVLGELTPADQTAIMGELSQAREVPPEIVKDIEAQVKGKLPYLVGGVDWIQSVYQYTQPQTQRALLGTLNEQSPELAQALRRKTVFFEDIAVLNAPSLRIIFQEIGYPVAALCLKDERADFRTSVLQKLPPAVREIIQQELDMSGDDKAGSIDAKTRVLTLARRLLQEGRITLPEKR